MNRRITLLILLLLALACNAYAGWYNGSWAYTRMITLDHSKVSGSTQINFPVLIDITDTAIQDHAQADGDDILFTSSDGTTKLSHQIELYDSGTGHLIAWVKVPSLSHTTDTVLYLYYGNSGAANQEDASNVWDSDFQAVWHMNDAGPTVANSKSTSYNGDQTNGVTFGATGKLGAAASFDGADDYVDFGDVLDMGLSDRTASCWFKTSTPVGALFGKSLLGQAAGRWTVVYESGSLYSIFQGIDGEGNWRLLEWNSPNFADNAWHNLTIVYDRSAYMTAYVDGAYSNQIDITNGDGQDLQTTNLFYLGRYQNTTGDGPHVSYIFNGLIDEVRISDAVRSADWIATEYNNQNSPSTFIKTIGDETLPVEMSSFTAVVTADLFVNLHWVTQSETDVLGYYVYRNTSQNLSNASIVSPFIPATNTSSEAFYSYTDEEVSPGLWYYWLQNLDMNGDNAFHGPLSITLTTDNGNPTPEIPLFTSLQSIYPNPFNPNATIAFGLAKAEKVSIEIYNIKGAKVRSFLSGTMNSGTYRRIWDGTDDNGRTVSTGVYYVKMNAGTYTSFKKIVLMK